MLNLILIMLVVFAVLSLLLAAWTMFFQGYIYSEPVSAIHWRAPAAGAALTLFLGIWVAFDYGSIHDRDEAEGRYQPLHNFSAKETETYKHLWVTTQNRKDEHFVLQGNQYIGPGGRRLPERPLQVVASDKADGEKHVFKPQLDAKGNFKVGKNESLRYYEDGDTKKRYMEEGYLGQITIFHFGWLVMGLFLNFGFLLVWFLVLWLLLRFQWSHALGLAFAAWIISIFLVPMILTPAEKLRKERLPPKTTTAMGRLILHYGARLPVPVRE